MQCIGACVVRAWSQPAACRVRQPLCTARLTVTDSVSLMRSVGAGSCARPSCSARFGWWGSLECTSLACLMQAMCPTRMVVGSGNCCT